MKRKGLTVCMAVMMAGMLSACASGQDQAAAGDTQPTGEAATPTISVEVTAGNDDIEMPDQETENGMKDNTENSADAETDVPEENTDNAGDQVQIPEAYRAILEKYLAMITEKWDNGRAFDEDLCTIISEYGEYTPDQIGYCLYDLNSDGEPELLIGPDAGDEYFGDMIYDAYTISDGQAKQLFVSHARNRYYLIEDEAGAVLIANEGSNGAASSCWFYYNMQDDRKLHLVQGIIYDEGYDAENPWFSVYDGWAVELWDLSQAEPMDSGLASDIVDAYTASYTSPEWTALSMFGE